jgi:electron transport complex, RnfABCDGE type, D subunit
VVLVSVAAAMGAEALLQVLMKRRVAVGDCSAAVTGLLLALGLPPSVPFWIPMIGSVFAIALVKQCFGGIGYNFLNPALAARAFLMVSWLGPMTAWSAPIRTIGEVSAISSASVDAISSSTALGLLKGGAPFTHAYLDLALGNVGGCIGETSAIALALGGVYLLARRVIDWRIPGVYVATVAAFTWIAGPEGLFTGDALYHVLSGGLMLGAIYMATDYVTSPITGGGRIVFALGCGILTSVIRLWGGYPEGVSYAILLMNLVVPLLDRAFAPKLFGRTALKEAAK